MRIASITLRLGTAISLGVALAVSAAEPNENWPQWRGPHLNGASTTAQGLPVRWSETENVVWRTKLPSWSAATPIIWGDTVFVTSAEEGFSTTGEGGTVRQAVRSALSKLNGYDDILLLAINRKDGAIRWQKVIGESNTMQMKQNMASPSPVTDGKHVWTMTGTGRLACFDFAANQIWQRSIQEEYGNFGLNFGYGSSPLLHDGVLYIEVLHGMKTDEPSYVFAADAATGRTIWKQNRPTDAEAESPDSYSTPVVQQINGETRLIVAGGGYVTAHDLKTGKEIWRGGGLIPNNEGNYRTIASAVVVNDIVLTPSRRRPFLAYRGGGRGDVTRTHQLWSTDYGPDVPTPATDGERLYIVDDKGIALCLRVNDGSLVWDRSRLEEGTYSASPLLADGKIYAISEEGTTTVFKAGDKFEILSVNKLNNYTLASPAVAHNQIFIRTADYLYCIGKPGAPTD
ncbi:MAG: PQQ-binding-like beta-propeller repeat protein [Bryobacterales bacterium]